MRNLVVFLPATAIVATLVAPAFADGGSDRLFRSTGPEVRLRCGSELLRARLRAGRLEVQIANGDRLVLTPIVGPGAVRQGPAYGDGRLTLYKIRDPQIWALSRSDRPGAPVQQCVRERRNP